MLCPSDDPSVQNLRSQHLIIYGLSSNYMCSAYRRLCMLYDKDVYVSPQRAFSSLLPLPLQLQRCTRSGCLERPETTAEL